MTNDTIIRKTWARGVRKVRPWIAALSAQTRPLATGKPHGLPGPLIVSLTSYPARFPTVFLTLRCLLSQTTAPDKVILWVASGDLDALPHSVLGLVRYGLEVQICDNFRSFNKIIPALERYPDAFIVTADDDVQYDTDWLELLVKAWSPDGAPIICHRAHEPRHRADGRLAPYKSWRYDVREVIVDSRRLFPTGVGGVLYSPGSLPMETLDRAVFQDLCPTADDVWLYFMGMLNGAVYSRIAGQDGLVSWPGTQEVGLFQANDHLDMNDVQIEKMERRYGRLG